MCCAASSTAGCNAPLAEHQRSAVARALALLRTHGGVLLADEPGLGKSYVAAAVACALREEGYEIELIVPAALVTQWRRTLEEREAEARIFTHDGLGRDPFVADPSRRRLVIVDEAHAFRNPATKRHDALARRTVAARILLVTATPLCNSVRDLHALLALVFADDVLADAGLPSIDAAFETRDVVAISGIVAALVIRRDRTVLADALRFGDLRRRVVRHDVTGDEGIIDRLTFPLVGGTLLLRRFLRRRLESSEVALLESVRRQLRFYDRAIESLRGGRLLTKRDYRAAFGGEEDAEALQQVLFWDVWAPPATTEASHDLAEVSAEMGRLRELQAVIGRAPRAKLRELLDLLQVESEPALIFTGSVATARELFAALRPLRRAGLVTSRDRLAAVAAIEAFRRGALDLLVATDLAAEGLNLQRAGLVVHYDLPWNPVKLDQRNGRAHRIGQQRATVEAIYFLPRGDESGVLATVAAKNRARRQVLRAEADDPPVAHAGGINIRPRLTRAAAAAGFLAVAERAGFTLPEGIERRHKRGIETLLREMAGEYLDERRIADLLAVLEAER